MSRSPYNAVGRRDEVDVPIRLYRFQGKTRPRWAARIDVPTIGSPEGYGALPDEALRNLAAALSTSDLEHLRVLSMVPPGQHAGGHVSTPGVAGRTA